jgi:hypothetical protein
MDMGDLAAGDLAISVDCLARRSERGVGVCLEMAAGTGQGGSGGDERGDGETRCEPSIGVLIDLAMGDRIRRNCRS